MLQLEKHEVDMSNVNLRKEKHGQERKLGVDITAKFQAGNLILDSLEKGLRESLFRPAGKGEQIDLVEGSDGLVAVKHPCLSALKLEGEYPGYEVEVIGLLDGDQQEPLALVDVTLKDIVVDPLEGGSVQLTVKLQVGVEADELAEIGEYYTRSAVRLTLTPPSRQEDENSAQQELPEAA